MSVSRTVNFNRRRTFNPDDMKTKFWSLTCNTGLRYVEVIKKKYCVTQAILDPNSCTPKDYGKLVLVMMKYGNTDHIIAVLRHGEIYQVPLSLHFDRENIIFYLKGTGCVELLGYEIISTQEIKENTISVKKDEKTPVPMANPPLKTKKPDVSKRKRASSSKDVCIPSTSRDTSVNSPEKNYIMSNSKSNKVSSSAKKKAKSSNHEDAQEDDVTKLKLSLLGDKDLEEESSSGDEDFDVNKAVASGSSDEDSDNLDSDSQDAEEDVSDQYFECSDSDDDTEDDGSDDTNKKNDVKESKTQESGPEVVNESRQHQQVPLKRKKNANANEGMSKKRSKLDKSPKTLAANGTSPQSTLESRQNSQKDQQTFKKTKDFLKKKQDNTNFIEENASEFRDIGSGVLIKDVIIGNGPPATEGKLVSLFYVGRFVDKKIFDCILPAKKPLTFQLGTGKMVKGFELGIEGMNVGGKRKIVIPPRLGYGSKGFTNVPPNTTLYYTVELTNVG